MRNRKATDLGLLTAFLLSAVSGIRLHVLREKGTPDAAWGWIHCVVSVIFFVLAAAHLCQHLPWYRALGRKAPNAKIRQRRSMVIVLDALLLILFATGILSIFLHAGHIGMAHYVVGLLTVIFALIHIVARRKMLRL